MVNGDAGTVIKVNEKLNAISVEINDGSNRTIALGSYDHVKLSYAITSHRGQGITVDNGFVLTDECMTHQEITYVQASRHRFETRIYSTK